MSLLTELRRRNVFRVGIAYVLLGWALLQGADFTLDLIGAPDWVIRSLAVVVAIGLPFALFFAWAFELTPEGIKRESEVDRSASVTPRTGRKLDRAIIIFLVLVIAVMALERFWPAGQPDSASAPGLAAVTPAEGGSTEGASSTSSGNTSPDNEISRAKSIAVLPFADLSQGQDQAWFADGLAEEILNALARAPDLLVASRTASFAYRDTERPVPEVARELGVDHVLEGSVRRAGNRIRVTAQLIRSGDGFHLWSQNYDRDADDVIAIQEEVAIAIARALRSTMDPETLENMLGAGTRNVEAYQLYLEGLAQRAKAGQEADFALLEASYEAFEAARRLDPGFSAAHSAAALYWRWNLAIARRGLSESDRPLDEKMDQFRERIEAAIDTAPNSVERQRHELLLAIAQMRLRDAIRLGRAVLQERPYDLETLDEFTDAAIYAADREALAEGIDRALTMAERNSIDAAELYIFKAWQIGGEHRDRDAWVADTMRLVQRSPRPGLAYQAHRALLWVGELEKARSLLPLLTDDDEGRDLVQARQACAEGRRQDAEAILASLPERWGNEREELATRQWHLYEMLGRDDDAASVLKPYESLAAPLAVGNYLTYPQFDPSPFPVLMSILEREAVVRPPPVQPGFQCPPPGADRTSVAVLPFRALSSGEDDEYFADGLTEEILNALAHVPELSVTSRTSAFHFKDQDLPIGEIADQLGVDHVVEGSVRRSGDRLRVTAQLIRASDDSHLWSENYDRTDADAIAVQEDIAQQIAETLGVFLDESTLAIMRSAGLRDVTAFIEYQKGLKLQEQAHGHEVLMPLLAESNAHLEAALAIQPNFAPAWLFYSDYYTHLLLDHATGEGEVRLSEEEIRTTYEAGRNAFQRAARAAANADARNAIELDLAIYEGNGAAWRPLLEQVLASKSCEDVIWHQLVGFVPEYAVSFAEATRRLRACDPMTNRYSGMIMSGYVWGGAPGDGLALPGIKSAEIHPFYLKWKIRALIAQGAFDEGETTATIDSPTARARNQALVLVAAARGDREEAQRRDERARSGEDNHFFALQRAAWLGDRQRANEIAALVDGETLGHLSLLMTTYWCACGAPFDLEAAPNFATIWQAADLAWPLESPIDFPLKDW